MEDGARDELLGDMATSMLKKYDKYWGKLETMNIALILATILDPRYKLEYVKEAFEIFHDVITCAKLMKTIEEALRRTFDQYYEVVFGFDKNASQEVPPQFATPGVSSDTLRITTVTSKPGRVMSKLLGRRRDKDGGKLKTRWISTWRNHARM